MSARTADSGRVPAAVLAAGLVAAAVVSPAVAAAELRLAEGTNLSVDVSRQDGRVAFDLLGSLWVLPAYGGEAEPLGRPGPLVAEPRWSPDGRALLARSADGRLWRIDADARRYEALRDTGGALDAAWHPSGERIVFAAVGDGDGLDLIERDLATGLEWRLTAHPGDESAPAWSADGRHLVYVLREAGQWSLMLRRFGHPPRVLVRSELPLAAPAWRPDNTLVTFLRTLPDGSLGLRMLILSDPPLERVLGNGEDYFADPVSWADRERFVYAADGVIRSRRFADRASRAVPFSAAIDLAVRGEAPDAAPAPLPERPGDGGSLVLRAERLYDGETPSYRQDVDILIEDGRIVAVEPATARDGVVIDVPGATALPGLIDTYAGLDDAGPATALRLLAFGVTTLVTPDAAADTRLSAPPGLPAPRLLVAARAGDAPGGRDRARIRLVTTAGDNPPAGRLDAWRRLGVPVLADSWVTGLVSGADLLLGTVSLPVSPAGRRYGDISGLAQGGPVTLVSGLADAGAPGLDALFASPQAALLGSRPGGSRRYGAAAGLVSDRASVVLGSRPSGLPAGLATQAELLAMQAAGLAPASVLHAATGAAADVLGLGAELGRIRPGARADLLLVSGDPLADVAAAGQVIAIVVDGRFLSIAGLLEQHATGVE